VSLSLFSPKLSPVLAAGYTGDEVTTTSGEQNRDTSGENTLDNRAMDSFLRGVERRAFLMARTAVGNEADALDIVQDAMCKMVEKYSKKPEKEWRPLFYRILNNRITDFYRKQGLKQRFFDFIEKLNPSDQNSLEDPMAYALGRRSYEPDAALAAERHLEELVVALSKLPPRQRQAFILRCWDGMDTASTAKAMLCSVGSVKTHYSRALTSLREAMTEAERR